MRPFEAGESVGGGLTAYGVTIPTTWPRVFVIGLDLQALEAAWGKLVRDHAGYAVWWNAAAKLRARFDVSHPTPRFGRGLELAPYVSTLDRVANLDELVLNNATVVPPGEWDPGPVAVSIADAKPGKRLRFTVRVDAPPVDEAALLAKLREIYGTPVESAGRWWFANGRVVVRPTDHAPAVEITYIAP